jgi:hypothetical protein
MQGFFIDKRQLQGKMKNVSESFYKLIANINI